MLLKNVKGLGLKTAQKIIVELSGKLALSTDLGEGSVPAGADTDEAIAALVMLGFAKSAAEKAVRQAVREQPAAAVEQIVRLALKML